MDNYCILYDSAVHDNFHLHPHTKVLERTGDYGSLPRCELLVPSDWDGEHHNRLSYYIASATDHLEATDEFQGAYWCLRRFLNGTSVSTYWNMYNSIY